MYRDVACRNLSSEPDHDHACVQAMGAGYLQERPEVAGSLLATAQALNISVSCCSCMPYITHT